MSVIGKTPCRNQRNISDHRMREFIGKSIQGCFGEGVDIFDFSLELQTATTKAIADIDTAIRLNFEQVITYGKNIRNDVEARNDVKGKFA